jgi:hypothetical protein
LHPVPTATTAVIGPFGGRRSANPIRLSVARELGHDIDGAWWPRADRITNELPSLVSVLTPLLGDITSINVNRYNDHPTSTGRDGNRNAST